MKILFIHNRYRQLAGEDVAVQLESDLLVQKGHEVKIMLFDNREISGFFSQFRTVLSSLYNSYSAKRISDAIKAFTPDVVHVHNIFFKASPSVFHAAKKHNIPVIHTLHNYRLICCNALLLRNNEICELCVQKKFPFDGIRYKCYRNSHLQSAMVTAITAIHKLSGTWKKRIASFVVSNEFSRSKLIDSSLGITGRQIIAKSNFVNDPGQGKLPRENFFLFAGRISKEKGVHVLIEAFTGLPEHNLVIAGDGPEKNSLEERYASYNNISFAGQLDKEKVIETMKRCKAFICPSVWYEMTPYTNFEALATGTPVIVSRLGSMTATITDGHDGLHFKAGDAIDLREKVKSFTQRSASDEMFYKNARQTYLDKYHPDIHYKAIMKIYQSAIAKNND